MEKHALTGLDKDMAEEIYTMHEEFEKEDRQERDEKRPLWLKLENYFNGFQRRFWDAEAKDWRIVPSDDITETDRHYDKIINIYRGHGEAIISALSIKTPTAVFYPEDADVIEDVQTAKACVKIKELIERHNDAKLLLVKALMILFNQGVVAAYVYNRKNSSYGMVRKAQYGPAKKLTTVTLTCKECGSYLDDVTFEGDERKRIPETTLKCPVCGYDGVPEKEESEELIPQITGYNGEAKTRTKIEMFSPLYVHMPFYARNQELIPSMSLEFEQHYSLLKSMYPKLIKEGKLPRIAKVDPQNERRVTTNKQNLVTTKCRWIRPWAYNITDSDTQDDSRKKLLKRIQEKFPDGIYCVILDDEIVEVKNENLDTVWHISQNPLSHFIHAEPIGKPLAPIQDLKTEVVDLRIETFEHAIPETFADGEVLNFKKYGESRAAPGMMFKVKQKVDGQPIRNSFHSLKTATLSQEAEIFDKKLDESAQFAVSSYPSIYGAPANSGSKTAKEYVESRQAALQRLGLTWNIIKFFWAGMMGKAVPLYIKALRSQNEDEKYVIKNPNNKLGFVNIWIKQSEITGVIGRIEADTDEEMPITAQQLKSLLVELIALKDDSIKEAILHPQNAPLLTKAFGAPDFYIPNSDIRDKQYGEIAQLLQGIPVEIKDWEDHEIEAEVCKTFLISESGLGIAVINPEGRDRVEEHMLAHMQKIAPPTASQQQPEQPQSAQPPAPGAVNPAGAMV